MAANHLPQQHIDALFNFVGYGPKHPRFIFIGAEEGSDGLLLNLQVRATTFPPGWHDRVQACADLAAGYVAHGLHAEAQRYVDALTPGTEPTWTFAARLLAALRASADWRTEYQQLGTLGGDTLLTELFPLPKPGTGCWPAAYAGVFHYPDQGRYYDGVWPRAVVPGLGTSLRANLLATTLAQMPPSRDRMIFGYGRGGRRAEFWERFDRLFGVNGRWTVVRPGVSEIARHRSGAVVARLAHPAQNRITAADIPQLVAAIGNLP